MAYFVATDGTGDGSILYPTNITTALGNNSTRPGTVIYLRAGTYGIGAAQVFSLKLKGTAEAPIQIMPYNNETVIIDGGFNLGDADYVEFYDLIVMNSSILRTCQSGQRSAGFLLYDANCKIINCILHDTGHPPISVPSFGNTVEIYGCIFYYCGFYDTDWDSNPRGTGIYGQGGAGPRLAEDNISFKNWVGGMKGWGNEAHVQNWIFRGNCCFNNPVTQIFLGTMVQQVENVLIEYHYDYCFGHAKSLGYGAAQIGYFAGQTGKDVTIQDSVFWSQVRDAWQDAPVDFRADWEEITFEDNTVVATNQAGYVTNRTIAIYDNDEPAPTVSWDNNDYYGSQFYALGSQVNFADWKTATGFDAASSQADGVPASNMVFVRANKYKPGRAHIIVYNFEDLDTVSVDVSAILDVTDTYIIRDVENYFGATVGSGTYDGNPVDIDMTASAVATIIGEHPHLTSEGVDDHTPKEFGCFVLERT